MNSCRKIEDILVRFIHGEVLLGEKEDLETHLAVCSSCERLYRDIRDLDRVLREMPGKMVDPSPGLRAKILAALDESETSKVGWSPWRLAPALAAVAAGIAVMAVFRGEIARTPDAPPPSAGPAASAPQAPAAPAARPELPSPPRIAAAPKVRIVREVKVYFYYPPAQRVAVTGDFNEWDPEGVPLTQAGKPGLWTTRLRLKPGAYAYNFIVDGEVLVPDPNAPTQAPDGYGGTNSIMLVKEDRPT